VPLIATAVKEEGNIRKGVVTVDKVPENTQRAMLAIQYTRGTLGP
jgi:hypothetical protein